MQHPTLKKPNMFGGGAKPSLQLTRPTVTRPEFDPSRATAGSSDMRSSVVEGEGSFRPDSRATEARNKPFAKFGASSIVSRPESRIKPTPEETTAPSLETAMKPKVNFTGEIKARPKKKDDNFFDDPMPDVKMQKQAKPNLMKSRAPGEIAIDDKKLKEKNFFDEDFEDVQVPVRDAITKPNLGKPRLGASVTIAPNQLRSSVNPREERPENPYEEFEVLSPEQG